jgi:hypothetical protein
MSAIAVPAGHRVVGAMPENRERMMLPGARPTGTAPAVRALAADNVETFRRTEIKHAVRRKSFRTMQSFHVMRSFHAKAAGAAQKSNGEAS